MFAKTLAYYFVTSMLAITTGIAVVTDGSALYLGAGGYYEPRTDLFLGTGVGTYAFFAARAAARA